MGAFKGAVSINQKQLQNGVKMGVFKGAVSNITSKLCRMHLKVLVP